MVDGSNWNWNWCWSLPNKKQVAKTMNKIVQVLIASFTTGMLASIGIASAEIYMIQFGGFDNYY